MKQPALSTQEIYFAKLIPSEFRRRMEIKLVDFQSLMVLNSHQKLVASAWCHNHFLFYDELLFVCSLL